MRLKYLILENKKLLKGSKLSIDEDYPKNILQERKDIIPAMIYLREKGKYAILKYNSLIVDGKKIGEKELQQIKEEQEKSKKRHRSEEEKTNVEEANKNKIKKNKAGTIQTLLTPLLPKPTTSQELPFRYRSGSLSSYQHREDRPTV